MPAEKAIAALGLLTDPNRNTLPPGALSVATNVLVEREGVIEQRPGLQQLVVDGGLSPTAASVRMWPFEHDILSGIATSGGFSLLNFERAPATVAGRFVGPALVALHPYEAFQARGSIYVTGAVGCIKIPSVGTASYNAGMPKCCPPILELLNSGTMWLLTGNTVAYRLVLRRTDSNGYIVRGAPSGSQWLTSAAGATRAISMVVPILNYLHPGGGSWLMDLQIGDVIEVYRSAQVDYTTTEPPDDMNLVQEYAITSSDLTAGYCTITDHVTDAFRITQPVLYTSPSAEGIEGANEMPPWCSDVQACNRLAFYGDVQPRRSFTLGLSGPDGVAWTDATVVGRDVVTVDTTSGNPIVVWTGGNIPKVGQCVSELHPVTAGTYIQAESIVIAVSSPNVTLSKPALGTHVGVSAYHYDVVQVGGRNYYASNATDTAKREFQTGTADINTDIQVFCAVVNLDALGTVWAHPLVSGLSAVNPAVEFVERCPNTTGFTTTVYESVNKTETVYVPQDAYGSTVVRFDDTHLPGGIYVSKQDEPEAVPIANLVVVGDAQKRVLRMLPVREAVWVFKEDGLFRVSGPDAANMQVEIVDPSVTLLHSHDADVMDDVVYAWTSQGVQTFGDASGDEVSAPRIGFTLRDLEELLGRRGNYEFGQFLFCDTTTRRVYLGVPDFTLASSGASTTATSVYVYSARTQAWTQWAITPCAGCYDPFYGRAAFDLMLTELSSELPAPVVRANSLVRARNDATYGVDYIQTVTVTSSTAVGDGTYTVVVTRAGVLIAIGVGDVILSGSNVVCAITAVTYGASTITLTTSADPGTGSRSVYQAFTSAVTWSPFDLGEFEYGKRYRDLRFQFDRFTDVVSYYIAYSPLNAPQAYPASTTVTCTATRSTTATQQQFFRVGIPRNAGRGSQQNVSLLVRQALSQYALVGIAPTSVPGAERVTR